MLEYIQYALVTFASFAISIDCVIMALFYCNFVISSPVLLGLIAVSAGSLNFLLYQWDAFAQFKKAFGSEEEQNNDNKESHDSSEEEQNNDNTARARNSSAEENNGIKSIIITMISLCAGIGMFLFTYSVYLSFSIAFPMWVIVSLSVAIGLGTMLLMRNSMDKFFIKDFDKNKAILDEKKRDLSFWFLLLVFWIATFCLATTWWVEALAALVSFGASMLMAKVLAVVFVGMLFLAELVFCLDKANDASGLGKLIIAKNEEMYEITCKNKNLKALGVLVGLVFIVFNSIGNGIMGASTFSNKIINAIAKYSGILLSGSTMFVSVSVDVVGFYEKKKETGSSTNNKNVYKNIGFSHRLFAWFVCSAAVVACLVDMHYFAASVPLLGFIFSVDLLIPCLAVALYNTLDDKSNNQRYSLPIIGLVSIGLCCGLMSFTALSAKACFISSLFVMLIGVLYGDNQPDPKPHNVEQGGGHSPQGPIAPVVTTSITSEQPDLKAGSGGRERSSSGILPPQ
jgi:hypothetical protein